MRKTTDGQVRRLTCIDLRIRCLTYGLPLIEAIGNWAEWLAATDLPGELEAIRKATARDFPLGEEEFVECLEGKLNRRLRPQKAGRKPKSAEEYG